MPDATGLFKDEANKEADKKKREQVDVKNQAETLSHQIEKQLKEHGDKLSSEDKQKIENDVATLKTVLESGDTEATKEKIKTLTESAMKLGEAIYKTQQTETKSDASEKKDDVVDAEYQEVDQGKKE